MLTEISRSRANAGIGSTIISTTPINAVGTSASKRLGDPAVIACCTAVPGGVGRPGGISAGEADRVRADPPGGARNVVYHGATVLFALEEILHLTRRLCHPAFLCLCVLLFAVALPAQEELKVGVAVFPPNVVRSPSGEVEGFDIDLWQEIGRRADLHYSIEVMPFDQVLAKTRAGELDAALGGITINSEREAALDFSYPYMEAGLRILTPTVEEFRVWHYVQAAFASGAGRALLYLAGFILLCAHILYFAERGSPSIQRPYFPGIFEAAWCIVATMTTVGYGDITPHKWIGRFVAFAVMITGIGLFGVLVADLSSGLTLQELKSSIRGPKDLAGLRVATVTGSTSVAAARKYGASIVDAADIDQAINEVLNGKADAVVFDGPPLAQYLKNHAGLPLTLAPPIIDSEMYGIAFPEGSALREPVNRALLEIDENGLRDQLRQKWFGSNP